MVSSIESEAEASFGLPVGAAAGSTVSPEAEGESGDAELRLPPLAVELDRRLGKLNDLRPLDGRADGDEGAWQKG